jgi:CBS domain-containing protein
MPLIKRRELPLRVADIMVKEVVTAKEHDKIRDVAIRMYEKRVGSVVVVDDEGKPIGIVTERDMVYVVRAGASP